MRVLVRALLVWLLVLAVPAQGIAAATMAFCGPGHHGSGSTAQMHAAAPADHAHHGGAAETGHEHHQAASAPDEEASATALTAKDADPSKHKCSACASCCSVGAILSSVQAVPALDFTPTVFSAVVLSVDTFAADGPDRPPRLVLA
jgi:hypothetical protein